jgi:hypothetical protein
VSPRNVIIVSPYFPPSTLAGVHRARHLAKHLPACEWHPIILCVDEADHEERLDPGLSDLLSPEIEIVKVRAVPAHLTRKIGVGDISIRAWFQLRRALFHLIAARSAEAVMITGSPYYPMLLAGAVKKKFGIPVLLDFQDPWVSSWGDKQPIASKGGLSHWLASTLEPLAVQHADFITSVSETQNGQMAARYSWLNKNGMAAIPIGGDLEDFKAVRQSSEQEYIQPGLINLSYVGTVLPNAVPLLQLLFRAFAQLQAAKPELAARIRLNFIGTSNQPNDRTTFRALPLAQTEGVGAHVHETPERIPYLRALSVLVRSNGLLLIGSDEPHYTASKIYPALMSGRPYLSLFHSASSAHRILSNAGGGRSFGFADHQELQGQEASIAATLSLFATPEAFGRADPASYAPYEASAIASRFGQIFSSLTCVSAKSCARLRKGVT